MQVIKLGNKKMKTNIYDQITAKIIEQLENGIVPWHKPWVAGTHAGCISHTNGQPYSEINQMLLGMRAGEWLTYNQIQAEGGHVKKRRKGFLRGILEMAKQGRDEGRHDHLDGRKNANTRYV